MGPKTQQLVVVLDELVSALAGLGEHHWCTWLSESAARLRDGDSAGITHLLAAYGGMGSFNDLLFDGSKEPARRAEELRGRAWSLASELFREALSQ